MDRKRQASRRLERNLKELGAESSAAGRAVYDVLLLWATERTVQRAAGELGLSAEQIPILRRHMQAIYHFGFFSPAALLCLAGMGWLLYWAVAA